MLNEAQIRPEDSGMEGVYIWIAPNKTNHGKRVKISNKKHKFDHEDCFSVSIPDLQIVAGKNENFTRKEMIKINKFLFNNINEINDFYNDMISTDIFINNLNIDIEDDNNDNIIINEYKNPIDFFGYNIGIAKFRDRYFIDDDKEYMDKFFDTAHNIEEIRLYIGPSSVKNEVVVKVCNNKLPDNYDIFTIYVKEKIIKGEVKISDDKLFRLLQLIEKNKDNIIEYSKLGTLLGVKELVSGFKS